MAKMLLPDARVTRTAEIRDFVVRIPLHFAGPGSSAREDLKRWVCGDVAIRAIGVVPDQKYELPISPKTAEGRINRGRVTVRVNNRTLFEAQVLQMMDIWAMGGPSDDGGGASADKIDDLIAKLQPLGKKTPDDVGAVVGAIVDFVRGMMTRKTSSHGAFGFKVPLQFSYNDYAYIEVDYAPFAGALEVDLYGVSKPGVR